MEETKETTVAGLDEGAVYKLKDGEQINLLSQPDYNDGGNWNLTSWMKN